MGSIFLAAKVEECPCRLSDLINVFDHLCKKFRRKALDPLPQFGMVRYSANIILRQASEILFVSLPGYRKVQHGSQKYANMFPTTIYFPLYSIGLLQTQGGDRGGGDADLEETGL